ncbi:gamma protein [Bovine ephemeral fever virus]|uniref:Protein gamma n=1 Tax=Bovine ephemeral fever virus (strain BB7721) TaxID=928297 RepID=VPG_BEFVB|nr:gamma protein [Bovine ephemeral fever virus]Q65479.1 RecName: Full=Protein gamma [Bovine ephemeral fever virus strain BB7721]AAB63052.1 gamma protein [Bovine ephemeral fever virus]AAG10419.1 gamma protein [Bovine ephemeral fever virus]WOZ03543.1 gamma protein [Bovine ephemeral fever virus]
MDLKFRCLIKNVADGRAGEIIVEECLEIIEQKYLRLMTIDLKEIRSSMFDQESNPWVYVFGKIYISGLMGRAIGKRMVKRGTYRIKEGELINHFEGVHIHFYKDIEKIFHSIRV